MENISLRLVADEPTRGYGEVTLETVYVCRTSCDRRGGYGGRDRGGRPYDLRGIYSIAGVEDEEEERV